MLVKESYHKEEDNDVDEEDFVIEVPVGGAYLLCMWKGWDMILSSV